MLHFPAEKHHLRTYYRDLAAGAKFHPDDLTDELRLDWDELSDSEKTAVRDLTKKAAKQMAEMKAHGAFQAARTLADETAAEVAELVGDRIHPKPKRKLPDDPRELAKLIRRR